MSFSFMLELTYMKTNKGFALVSIVFIIIIVLVVGGITYYIGTKNNSVLENSVLNTNNTNTKQSISSNKLFDFFNTFTIDKDIGTPTVEFMYPEQKLILISYPTSQENGSYAVYDYKNDILYKGIGSTTTRLLPEAFIGSNKLLMYNFPSDGPGSTNTKGSLTVQDFNGKIIKTIMTDITLYEVYPKYGKIIVINTNTKDNGRFNLNSETLELSPWTR
jgi:hypothetical protein